MTTRDVVRKLLHGITTATALLAAVSLLASCDGERALGPDDPHHAPVMISAAMVGTGVVGLGITITGPGITTPVVANIPARGTTATGTIQVPTGHARLFTVRSFDAGGLQTHEGSTTADIRPGTNPTVEVRLFPLTAGAPISVGVGSYTLTLAPGENRLPVGGTRQYTATVTDQDGKTITDATIVWASLDPSVASISTGGLVTAHAAGDTRIIASFGGVAAQATLTVTPAT